MTDADVLLYNVGDAARAGGAGAGIFLVTDADIVTLLLAPVADVRQNDRVHVAVGTPAVGRGRGVTRVVALRVAFVAIVGPEDGGPCVATVGAVGLIPLEPLALLLVVAEVEHVDATVAAGLPRPSLPERLVILARGAAAAEVTTAFTGDARWLRCRQLLLGLHGCFWCFYAIA